MMSGNAHTIPNWFRFTRCLCQAHQHFGRFFRDASIHATPSYAQCGSVGEGMRRIHETFLAQENITVIVAATRSILGCFVPVVLFSQQVERNDMCAVCIA